MTSERWRRIEEVFERASAASPESRPALLDEACAGDAELRREVESLLACDADDDTFLNTRIAGAAEQVASDQAASLIGKRIGAWRITGVAGRGGMGAVYRAVRDDGQYDKEAALKLVRRGLASDADLRRFRRERQILARLEHPSIARLLDGGTTEDGLPYLVMEFVAGQPVTAHCRDLSVTDKLRLFRQVCAAVQYAHQNLIVHRDLKPGNILVTADGVPKLLDFGIAKLLDPEASTDDPAATITSAWMLTPDYASPEQILGHSITAASDVYSLGAILYELLTGRRAHQIKGRTAGEIERAICQEETERPSTATGSRQFRGDLDNIVLMAMRKQPSRRYGSVEQFSEDIRRYLEGLPVLARTDTLVYRAGKFLRRNRWPVAIGSVAAAGLIATTSLAIVQAKRAQRQSAAGRELAMTLLIDANERMRMQPVSAEARRIMVERGLAYLDPLSREAGNDPAVLWDLARGYEKIAALQGSPDPGEPNFAEYAASLASYRLALSFAQAVQRIRGMDEPLRLLLCKIHIGIGGNERSSSQARAHLDESLRLNAGLGSNTPKYYGSTSQDAKEYLGYLARVLLGRSLVRTEPARALEHYRQSGPLFSRPHIPIALDHMGDLEGALAAIQDNLRNIRALQASYPGDDIRKRIMRLTEAYAEAQAALLLGSPFQPSLGDAPGAMAACRRSLAILNPLEARDPSDRNVQIGVLWTSAVYGSLLVDRDAEESVRLYRKVLASPVYPRRNSSEPPPQQQQYTGVMMARWQISHPLRRLGQSQEALHEALTAINERDGFQERAAAAAAHMDLGNQAEALAHYRRSLDFAEREASAAPRNMMARAHLGMALERMGSFFEASRDSRTACEWYAKALNLWSNWTAAGGVSNPFVKRSKRQMAQAVARCANSKSR